MNIIINTVILATQEIIYRNRQIGSTIALMQVRLKLYNQLIYPYLLAKFSLDKYIKSGNPLKMIFVVIDCRERYVCMIVYVVIIN